MLVSAEGGILFTITGISGVEGIPVHLRIAPLWKNNAIRKKRLLLN
jgi:hypothetical protein